MPFQVPPRLSSVLASALAAGLLLTVGGCSHITPLSPDAAAGMPTPHHLRSPLVLQAMLVRQLTPAGGCPAGYAALAAGPGMCYRKTGTPVTITSAAVSIVTRQKPPPGPPAAHPTAYLITITLPAADSSALTAVAATAYNAKGALAISVAGKIWDLPIQKKPFPSGMQQFEISLFSRNQALQLQRILAASG